MDWTKLLVLNHIQKSKTVSRNFSQLLQLKNDMQITQSYLEEGTVLHNKFN